MQIVSNYDYEDGGVINEVNADFIAHARQDVPRLLEHIEEQDAKIKLLLAVLRQVEPLCRNLIRAAYGVGNSSGEVTQCKVCHAKFRSWEKGDKHVRGAKRCVFAMLED